MLTNPGRRVPPTPGRSLPPTENPCVGHDPLADRRHSGMTPAHRPTSHVTRSALYLAALLAAFTGACAGPPGPATAGPGYTELYSRGRYAEAQAAAAARAKELSSGAEREQAMLIAGQSAYALDHDAEAEVWLKPLLGSNNPSIAGKSAAVMGLIQQETAMHNRAIDLFHQAAGKLTGDDAARAHLYAGDSYRALDKAAEAKASYEKASALVGKDPNLKAVVADRLTGKPATVVPGFKKLGGFTLQLGAFSSLQRAQAMVDRQRSRLSAAGLGTARIIETMVRGKKTYLVQVGRFTTRPAADSGRAKIGSEAYVTDADD